MSIFKGLNDGTPKSKSSIPWLPISFGLVGILLFFTYFVRGEDENNKDAVVSWGEWSQCDSKGEQYRFSTILSPAIGNGKTPAEKEIRECTPNKEDDAIVWETWNTTRIINEFKNGNLTYREAYEALEKGHGWSNNDITDELTAEGIQSLDSSQSYMSEFF